MLMKLQSSPGAIDDRLAMPSRSRFHDRRGTGPRWLRVVGLWTARWRQRLALAGLDDRLLRDAGITRSEAARGIAKPFWL